MSKANQTMGIIRKSFAHWDCKLLRSLYVTFTRALLEFAVPVWLPDLKCDIDLFKIVQHQATSLIPSLIILNYEERLTAFDLTTLSERRQRGVMIQIFKIFHGIDIMEIENNFSFQHNQTRAHCFKYHREISRHTHRANFIFNRSANLWILYCLII